MVSGQLSEHLERVLGKSYREVILSKSRMTTIDEENVNVGDFKTVVLHESWTRMQSLRSVSAAEGSNVDC